MAADQCRIGVVGAGQWGPHLIRNFQTSGRSRVVSVADRDEGRLARIAAAHPNVSCTTDAYELLDRGDVDAVVIATPAITHYPLAKAALERALHVFVEKPLTHSLVEAEDLARQAAAADRLLFVGHVFLFNDALRSIKQRITAGDLGEIHYLHSLRTNLGPIRTDVSALWDLASHDISIFQYLLDGVPMTATAKGGSYINAGVEDVVFATLQYANGVLAHLHATWLSPQKIRQLTIVGNQRMMVFNDMDLNEPVRIYDKGVSGTPRDSGLVDSFAGFRSSIREGDITIPRVAVGEPLRNECEHFLDCLRRGTPCRSGAAEGVAVVRILEAIERSLRNGSAEVAIS